MFSVLPDSSCNQGQGEFGAGSPGIGGSGGAARAPYPALTELEPLLAPRYPTDPNTYPNNWSANGYSTYNNYQYNNVVTNNNLACAQPQGGYLNPPGPTMVLYPHLYSTVNQNQIHFHLHGSTDKLDQYFSGDSSLTISSGPSLKGGIEIGIGMPSQSQLEGDSTPQEPQDSDVTRENMAVSNAISDPSSVWRPY